MKKINVLSFLVVLLFVSNLWAANISRYDFQMDAGEGTQELYRIDVDLNLKKGEICFLNTGSSNVPDDKIVSIRKGTLWSKLIDFKKYDHTCLPFESYDPFGWFFTEPSLNSGQDIRLVFIGDMTKDKISGKIYQFIKIKDGKKLYLTVEERDVSAHAISVK
jgi:hypothetical protein